MDGRPRHLAGFIALACAGAIVLGVVLQAAGHGAALAVAIAAIAVFVASYLWMAVVIVRAYGDEDASAVAIRRKVRFHIPIMFGTPLVLAAAHPWGMATVAVGGALFVCQSVFLHMLILAGLVLRRRERRAPPG